MSQFDFPRINFHGTAFLDTATANNGKNEPSITLFGQNNSEVFIRKFSLQQNSGSWSLVNLDALTDSVNLHRRDFNLVP